MTALELVMKIFRFRHNQVYWVVTAVTNLELVMEIYSVSTVKFRGMSQL